jgi:membrane-associated protease RseP (regulator of RpoE activity)
MLSQIFYFIVLIGVLIFFHELGHFLFAKLFKVKVLRFALGFGPRLVGFRKGETDYCVCAFPLGGYVKMLGEDPTEELAPADRGRAFSDKPLYQRFLIVFAGPAFNLILPILLYFAFFATQAKLPPASLGTILVGMPAWELGLRPGDRIVAINGEPVRYWEQVQETISRHPGEEVRLRVERAGAMLPEMRITPRAVSIPTQLGFEQTVGQIGVSPEYLGTRVGVSDPESPAGKAGLRTWDQVVAIDGKQVQRWTELEAALFSGEPRPRRITLLRGEPLGVGFADLQALTPYEVELKPEPEGAAVEAVLGGLARALTRASQALARWVAGEPRPAGKPILGAEALQEASRAVGLGQALDLIRHYLPGPKALFDRAQAVVRRGLMGPRPGPADFLRVPALAVGDAVRALWRGARHEVAWPLLRALSGLLHRHGFLGLEPAEFYVYEVQPKTPAEAIGMKKGDRVVSLNGQGLTLWLEIDQVRRQNPSGEIAIAFVQDGRLVERRFRQEKKVDENEVERYIFGARNLPTMVGDDPVENEDRLSRALKRAVMKTGEMIGLMVVGIARLVEGKISFKTVGGPIMIFDIAGKAARRGWESFLWIMALISINLGLLNLLPIPVLDGGHLLFIGIEAVRRKPVSLRVREIAGLVGLALLVVLMVFAFKNDIERYWKDIVDAFR